MQISQKQSMKLQQQSANIVMENSVFVIQPGLGVGVGVGYLDTHVSQWQCYEALGYS